MDARSYRLPWRDGATVYEVDQPQVIAIKGERLAGERSRCRRVAVGVDLADDWPKALESQGFDSSARTVWLVEGLLQYIDAPEVDRLFARVDALSAPGSVCSTTSLARPCSKRRSCRHLKYMQKLGAPWVFGNDTNRPRRGPRLGATVTDMAVPGNEWKRWAHPPVPADVPNAPRGYSSRRSRPEPKPPPPPPAFGHGRSVFRRLCLGPRLSGTCGQAHVLPRVASGSTPSPRSSRIERRRFR